MKENKFKAWNKKEKRMSSTLTDIHFDGSIHSCSFLSLYGDTETVNIEDLELLQFIGRKDKHDKEIYEEDIIRECVVGQVIWDGDGIIEECPIGVVKWSNSHAGYNIKQIKEGRVRLREDSSQRKYYPNGYTSLHLSCFDGHFLWFDRELYIEIIGNTFENPELLEKKDG